MIKRILFPIAGSSSVESGLGTALTVATDFGAQLDVIFCRRPFRSEVPLMVDEMGSEWFSSTAKSFEKEEKRRVSKARKLFDRITAERNIPYQQYPNSAVMPAASWEVAARTPLDELILRAGATDMVVVGRSADSVGDLTRSLVETALFACGQPVMIAPREAPASIGTRILVGWNRSAPSARALKNAMPFLGRAQSVTLFMVSTGAKAGPEPADMASYLSLHGVNADIRVAPKGGTSVSEQLLSVAGEINADLLVMGAYSHSRLREFVLGGVTRDILNSAGLPVLMSR
jgi:nucleotide-binding universal stress UspA family protein